MQHEGQQHDLGCRRLDKLSAWSALALLIALTTVVCELRATASTKAGSKMSGMEMWAAKEKRQVAKMAWPVGCVSFRPVCWQSRTYRSLR